MALLLGATMSSAQPTNGTTISFIPWEPEFIAAVDEYRAIWSAEGGRIVEALRRATGLTLEAGPIHAIVYEGPSFSGYHEAPMRLRASYPSATKRATLVHELSHRLIADLVPYDFEDHPTIFLFVYDVWVELWGKEFADEQVQIESARRGLYDYESAWKDALALGADARAKNWSTFLADRQRR
jgi:hypothetical protein